MKTLENKIADIIFNKSGEHLSGECDEMATEILKLPELKAIQVEAKVIVNFTENEKKTLKSLVMLKILEAQQAIDNSIFSTNGTQKSLYTKREELKKILSKISE